MSEQMRVHELHRAIGNEDLPLVRKLLEAKVDVNAVDENDNNSLHCAVLKDDLSIVALLVAAKADCRAKNQKGYSPLYRMLCDRPDKTALIGQLMDAKADIDAVDQRGFTLLHLAAARGYVAMVPVLLEAKADSNAKNKWGSTPLHLFHHSAKIQEADNVVILNALLAAKADVNAIDRSGCTPLLRAAGQGMSIVVKALLAAKADIVAPDNDAHSPLWWAAFHKHPNTIAVLLDAKADPKEVAINTTQEAKNDRLRQALTDPFPVIVKALIAANADTNRANDLFTAATNPSHGSEYVTLLLKAKAKFSAVDDRGRTPLQIAERAFGRWEEQQLQKATVISLLTCKKMEQEKQERLLAILSGLHGRAGRRSVISQVARSSIFEERILKIVHHLAESAVPNAVSFFRKPEVSADTEQGPSLPSSALPEKVDNFNLEVA